MMAHDETFKRSYARSTYDAMLHPNLYINAFYAYFDIEEFHTVHIIVAHTAEKMKH